MADTPDTWDFDVLAGVRAGKPYVSLKIFPAGGSDGASYEVSPNLAREMAAWLTRGADEAEGK